MSEIIRIKADNDGFLLSKERADEIGQILDNTEELLKRANSTKRRKPRAGITVVAECKPQQKSKAAKVKPEQANRRRTNQQIARKDKTAAELQKNRQADLTYRRNQEKEQRLEFKEQKKQTAMLEDIAKGSKKGGKDGGGLMSLLGMGGGLLKGLIKSPLNFLKGAKRGGLRDAGGRFLPKGAAGQGFSLGKLGRWGKAAGKGGLLAAAFGLFDGFNIERSNADRSDKNKAHLKNLLGTGGGLAGAAAGATLGTMIMPGVGTVAGGLIGGLGGTALTDYATERLDKAIDPKLSKKMLGSWKGFTDTAKSGLRSMLDKLPEGFRKQLDNIADGAKKVKDKVTNAAENAKEAWDNSKVGGAVNAGIDKVKDTAGAAGRKISSFLGYDMTKKYDKTGYAFGGNDLNRGIDCSHWTFQIQKMETDELNKMLGYNKYTAPTYKTAEGQLKYFSDKNGVVTDQRDKGGIDFSKIKAGMVIGQHKFSNRYKGNGGINIKGYGFTRYNHVAKVVRGRDGELYVSESQGGSKTNNGVTLTPLRKWFKGRQQRGDNLTVVNPYGDDIGLLNDELGAVVKNGVAKAGRAVANTAGGMAGNLKKSLGDFITKGESNIKGKSPYDVGNFNVNAGTKKKEKYLLFQGGALSSMTIGQIQDLQRQNKLYAAGRYQVIPETLAYAVKGLKLDGNTKFNQETQDKIFSYLVRKKRPEVEKYIRTGQGFEKAADGLAMEWASIPVLRNQTNYKGSFRERGQSYYGNGVDKAHHKPEEVEAVMRQLPALYQQALRNGMSEAQAFEYVISRAGGGSVSSAQPAPRMSPVQTASGKGAFFIGDSIAHGYRTAAKAEGETLVGANPAKVLGFVRNHADKLKGRTVYLSTGMSNNPSDLANIEEQLKILKAAGANVKIIGVANDYKGDSKHGALMNGRLKELSGKYGAVFLGGFNPSKDKVHPSAYRTADIGLNAQRQAKPPEVKPVTVPTAKVPKPVPQKIEAAPVGNNRQKNSAQTANAGVNGGNIAHKPVNRTVSHGKIAHMASGGIMST